LDISKVEAGRLEVSLFPASLDGVVREVVKQFQGELQNKAIQIEVNVPKVVKPIATDASKLKQVLVNLIDNAVKYTDEGKISIAVVTCPVDSQPIRIDITDTGIGIPSDRFQDIFEPFFQLSVEGKSPSAGTGLGLSICRSLCDLLGYRLEVQSTRGKGSRFSIVLGAGESAPLLEKAG
jgi:signal transduction histidine kinase